MDEWLGAMRHRSTSAVGGGVGAGVRPVAVMHGRRRHATPSGAGGGRLSPTMVLVMSLCFIGFATAALYVFGFGKLYRSRTAAASSA